MAHGPVGVVNGPQPSGTPQNGSKPAGVVPNAAGAPSALHLASGTPSPGPGPVGVQPTTSVTSNLAPGVSPGISPAPHSPHIFVQPQGSQIIHQQVVSPMQRYSGQHLGIVPQNAYGHGRINQGQVSVGLQGVWSDRKQIWRNCGGVVVTSVLSIHNRSKLFRRALYGYLWQTMPAEHWEILLVDDCSTEDLSETYKPLLGRINLRHVKFDHTRHPLFKAKNPNWEPGKKKNWYHTPALTINLGMYLARGPIISLCHPEVLHAPENFELASVRILDKECYLFGTTYLGTQDSNRWLDKNPSWVNFGWQGFLSRVAAQNLEKYGGERYWYTSFLPRVAARKIGGVDFQYLNGVAGEDDDFRDRIDMAGYKAIWAPELEGFHQDHSDESEAHRIRTTDEWKRGLQHNRDLYSRRRKSNIYPIPANTDQDWTARECFVEELRYKIGSRTPELITKVP